MGETNRDDELLKNIMEAVELEPVKVSSRRKRKLALIKFASASVVRGICHTVIALVLVFLVTHLLSYNTDPNSFRVVDNYLEDGVFYMEFAGGTPDTALCYMEATDGSEASVLDYDKLRNRLSFACEEKEYNIYVVSQKGKTLTMIFKPN